jgi:hypothetical protein
VRQFFNSTEVVKIDRWIGMAVAKTGQQMDGFCLSGLGLEVGEGIYQNFFVFIFLFGLFQQTD